MGDFNISGLGRSGSSLIDISEAVVTRASSSFTYDGNEKTQEVSSVVLDGTNLTEDTDYIVSGNTAIGAGTHTLAVEGIGRYEGVVTADWSIAKRKYTKPTITTHPTYTGSSQSPTVSGYVPASMTQTGDTQATNAGSYTLTISLNDTTNNAWSDNTTSAVNLAWHISKATGSVSVSPNSLSITTIGDTATATIAKTGDGTVSAQSSDSGVATVAPFVATVTGSIVSVTDAAPLDAENVTVDIEPVQDLHGYENPWPAGGGKNKLPNTASTKTINGVKFTIQEDTSIKVENTASANTAFVVGSVELSAGTYILSGITGGIDNDFYIQVVNESQTTQIAYSYNGDKQFTLSDSQVVVYSIFVKNGMNTNGKVIYPMIRLSTEADAYFAPYSNICPITGWTGANIIVNGNTIAIAFPSEAGTVYGGTLDVTTGVLTVDRGMVDLGMLNWSYSSNIFLCISNIGATNGSALCSIYKQTTASAADMPDKSFRIIGWAYNNSLWCKDTDYSDTASFKVAMSGVQFVYELDTPITYQLTPQQIALLRGNNTLSADTGDTTLTYQQDIGAVHTITVTAVADGTATITVTLAEGNNYLGSTATLSVSVQTVGPSSGIYGVSWDKSSSTTLSRTDDAALFTDPVPAVSNGNGSSPFDTIAPWSGMVRETVDGNAMVKIPKFYFKWTDDTGSLKLQISPTQQTGFHVSPAHADRGDGKGEREYVYVGRYHCGSDYTSKTGVMPLGNINRATARTSCANLGTGYYQYDYAMLCTIRMLYLVEYADWDSQKVIGYGCSPSGSAFTMGYTDSMTYHTGTDAADRTTYGGTQYRYIEGLWDNVRDWCDGIVFSSRNPYVTLNPANYGDSITNHTRVGTGPSSNGDISGWNVPTTFGLEWALYPNATNGSDYTVYCADYCNSGGDVANFGGNSNRGRNNGLFCSGSETASAYFASIGVRLQKLP